jgi:hypothetical protein
MARRKMLSQRTMMRIAARRSGMFNQPEYRAGVNARKDVSAKIMAGLGIALTVASGGAALPLGALLMVPAAANCMNKKDEN